ncbi:MAG: Re/Si-specific NAD(P)(+) transhydrogenase subunit alpha [Planctomycetes bacterium]|nr:Re/Si-specific NAD(P)(+) transhydrogenase subunit alpha [Planctomycetota bacterium]NUQ36157.1 Re/Si-specific NAD(P)(+) transhydrogenase subunit alpha [Planctomycetaceae bacterium]
MKIGIPKEVHHGEARVAATPDTVSRLIKLGFEVLVESSAGAAANFSDVAYTSAGAKIAGGPKDLWDQADWVLKVRAPSLNSVPGPGEVGLLRRGQGLMSFFYPATNEQLLKSLAERGCTVVAMDQVPRITRAQSMDALSSMANTAGYRAVIEAAQVFPRFFTGQITAAGKVPPAKVMVIGAGVAGLAAIGTAKGLGAIVRAFDTRLAAKEQVESMGGEFLVLDFKESGEGEGGYAKVMSKEFIDAEMKLFADQAKDVDIIITTALIPGKKAPTLITAEMVKSMKQGSVIVDLAAEQGGNCELTDPGKLVVKHGVSIIGYTDLPSRMASQSSQLYGNNLCNLLAEMGGGTNFKIDMNNEIVRGAVVCHEGQVTWPPPKVEQKPAASAPQAEVPKRPSVRTPTATSKIELERKRSFSPRGLWTIPVILAFMAIGVNAPDSFVRHFTVFVLACFVGWQVIWNVKPALHTPLMSVTNAISGIILLGGMLQLSADSNLAAIVLGAIAVFFATINVAGGFAVTERMLRMFRK